MPTVKLISFSEALNRSGNLEANSILLGNGFSASWKPEVFGYSSLFRAASSLSPEIRRLFKAYDTSDFEKIIRAYSNAAMVCDSYKVSNDFQAEAEIVRESLVKTISENHPERPDEITAAEYETCVDFLSNFKSKIYTVNYDMLLYWVLMHDMFREDRKQSKLRKMQDGFLYTGEDFLNWSHRSADIYYLHGALHLFREERLEKLNYKNTAIPLKQQFIQLIQNDGRLPLIVVEGSNNEKICKIGTEAYLQSGMRSLREVGG